jgi:NAD(P)-dependent dehydrogenase (short-subunit alcohol dehydrogenase family)
MRYYITGTRRGLGERLLQVFGSVSSLEECDVFINCKHNGFEQVELLYKAAELGKRIINIGSNSPDQTKKKPHPYQVEKAALDKANDQLFYQGVNTTIIRFGYIDTPRVENIPDNKMPVDYCVDVILWVLQQPHRVKDITVCP